MAGCFFFIGKEACAFKHNIYLQILPRKLGRIFYSSNFDFFSIYDDRIILCLYICIKDSEYRIIFKEMSKGLCVCDIIYCHKVQVFLFQ